MSESIYPKTKSGEILARLTAGKKSGWSGRARKRQEERSELQQSRRVALHLLNALEAKGMNQKQLAAATGVTPEYIGMVVRGKEVADISGEMIARLEVALNLYLA